MGLWEYLSNPAWASTQSGQGCNGILGLEISELRDEERTVTQEKPVEAGAGLSAKGIAYIGAQKPNDMKAKMRQDGRAWSIHGTP